MKSFSYSAALLAVILAVLVGEGVCWNAWSNWSGCIAVGGCDFGIEIRSRTCDDTADPLSCAAGEPLGYAESQSCWIQCDQVIIEWEEWNSWSSCSSGCDDGMRKRVRRCDNNEQIGSYDCVGPFFEALECSVKSCPLYEGMECYDPDNSMFYAGQIDEASDGRLCELWSDENSDYQPGSSTAIGPSEHSYCRNPNNLDKPWCYTKVDDQLFTTRCNVPFCNFRAKWGPWTCWSSWSATCDSAVRIRTRKCIDGYRDEMGCNGDVYEEEPIDFEPCPENCIDFP